MIGGGMKQPRQHTPGLGGLMVHVASAGTATGFIPEVPGKGFADIFGWQAFGRSVEIGDVAGACELGFVRNVKHQNQNDS